MAFIKTTLNSQTGSHMKNKSGSDHLFETKMNREDTAPDNEHASEMWMEIMVWLILTGILFFSV